MIFSRGLGSLVVILSSFLCNSHVAVASDLFDMGAIRDPITLEIEVLQEWHDVKGLVPTRQKLVTINVGNLWPNQPYRVPVRLVVPFAKRARGFHLTGASTPVRLQADAKLNHFESHLIRGGVGLVYTVVQEPGTYGQAGLAREAERRFSRTLDPHYKIQYWAWPATLMRAITMAYSESEYFERGKVAASGGSKNGASPSMAIIHDDRMTAIHAAVSPIWDSPLRLCDTDAWNQLKSVSRRRGGFSGGHFGPNFNQAALEAGYTWSDLQAFTKTISDDVFISRNLKALRDRGVDMLFHPGTHDMVAYDLAWGGVHHKDIPLYLGANTGHGKPGHPQLERNQQNKAAFLLTHFFPDQSQGSILPPPHLEYTTRNGVVNVSVSFPNGREAETGRIWWIYDRAPDGSPDYLGRLIPDDQFAEMRYDKKRGEWIADIRIDHPQAKTIDFFSNHRKTVVFGGKRYPTYISSAYTRAILERK